MDEGDKNLFGKTAESRSGEKINMMSWDILSRQEIRKLRLPVTLKGQRDHLKMLPLVENKIAGHLTTAMN